MRAAVFPKKVCSGFLPVTKQNSANALPASEPATVSQSQSLPVDNGIMSEDLWASLPAQEPSSKICGLLKTASKRDQKWKVREEALDASAKIVLALPHIKEGAEFYGDAYDTIKITSVHLRVLGWIY